MSEKVFKTKNVIARVLTDNNLGDILHLSRLIHNWEVIIGGPLAKKTKPKTLHYKELVIQVLEPAYAQHLKYYIPQILEIIATKDVCGEGVVNRIRFETGQFQPLPEPTAKIESKAVKRGLTKDNALKEAEERTIQIKDPRLQRALSRAMAQSLRNQETKDKTE
ncbi:MAG: DUF721 domain-containing protein [SAR324 cluster bacterium]|nr:DUF721 domain-containing protein [SAR324 cluster bacterium]